MPHIQLLDQRTIDKIAAGEVIERPASIVKELVENAIDAGASSINIEIRGGGIDFIRVADNGCGIPHDEVKNAFLRHSTSKIRSVEDLMHIRSLGFRGEALSSIAAVTHTELITKTEEFPLGTRYVVEGGKEVSFEETGAKNGTTFLVSSLFYNVPARRKFLKTPMTEAGHVQDLLIHLALSHPEISFSFVNNGQEKLRTSGNGRLKDVIYSVYGREIAANLLEMDFEKSGLKITGYLGKPVITRGNRNFENFFVNGRYVKSAMISRSLEDAYKDFSMQHKFPFAVLHFDLDGETIDVNVHPTKMELRFQRQQDVYNTVYEGVHRLLSEPELIQSAEVPDPVTVSVPGRSAKQKEKPELSEKSPFLLQPGGHKNKEPESGEQGHTVPGYAEQRSAQPEPAAQQPAKERKQEGTPQKPYDEDYFIRKMRERVTAYHERSSSAEVKSGGGIVKQEKQEDRIREKTSSAASEKRPDPAGAEQMDLFRENFLKRDVRADYKLIGQVFDTYWLAEFDENLYIIDQHAAHERVLYERTLKGMRNREYTSQYISPPIILSLTMQEAEILDQNMDSFTRIGFEIESFGGEEYAVRAVPDNLFSIAKRDLLTEMLDDLADGLKTNMTPELIDEKIASMSCKAAVKGNSRMSAQEADALIGELLSLDNPYHCPHGRPTIIKMSKREMEKKFKRIVS